MATEYSGTDRFDIARLGSGAQIVDMGAGNDRIISYGDAGEPDPAQTEGAEGRVTPAIPPGEANDTLTGGAGIDTFEFRALLDARRAWPNAGTAGSSAASRAGPRQPPRGAGLRNW